jgi:hypothetical protein
MRSLFFGIVLTAACAAQAQQPAPAAAEPAAPAYSVVEPKVPPPKPQAKAKARGKTKAKAKANSRVARGPSRPAAPQLKRSGPCIVKPVMSDQDLVNCGATPPRY